MPTLVESEPLRSRPGFFTFFSVGNNAMLDSVKKMQSALLKADKRQLLYTLNCGQTPVKIGRTSESRRAIKPRRY